MMSTSFKIPLLLNTTIIYNEKTKYECRSHLDPEFTWSEQEEKKVTWKNDWNVTF